MTTQMMATAGGPPGTKKVTDGVDAAKLKKQLGELVKTAVLDGGAPKVSAKKAMKWALKKFGAEGVYADGERNEKQARRWAVEQYTEHKAKKEIAKSEPVPPKNDAMQALTNGAAKRKEAKQAQERATEAKQRDQEINSAFMALKLSTDAQLKNAMLGFIDGPVKDVMDSFVRLFASRKTEGDSDEAVLALDACRKAFDACGLQLVDVETKPKATAKVSTTAKPVTEKEAAKDAKREFVGKQTKKRKPLTKEQREAKNKRDRDRRKTKKGSKK